MPLVAVEQEWLGEDAIVLGGGASLSGYDFQKISGWNVIGINDAFRLGPAAVPITLFGDDTWWQQVKHQLQTYAEGGGRVFSVAPASLNLRLPWLYILKRIDSGWGTGEHLGWNLSTGAAGINLAVSLGAKRIFLMGFDCTPAKKTHWHPHRRIPTSPASFIRFQKGFDVVALKLSQFAPDVKVFNTNPESGLNQFQKCTLADMERLLIEADQERLALNESY